MDVVVPDCVQLVAELALCFDSGAPSLVVFSVR